MPTKKTTIRARLLAAQKRRDKRMSDAISALAAEAGAALTSAIERAQAASLKEATETLTAHVAQSFAAPLSRLGDLEQRADAKIRELDSNQGFAKAARAALLAEIGESGAVDALMEGSAELLPQIDTLQPWYVRGRTGELLARALRGAHPMIVLAGPSGCGKTLPARQELARLGRRALVLSCADGLTRGDLLGRQEARDGATHYSEGPLPRAARLGLALILDEYDRIDPLLASIVNACADAGALVPVPDGAPIKPKAGFVLILTCNGLTDETGLYVTQASSADLPNRAFCIAAEYLTPEQERNAIEAQTGVPRELATRIVNALTALRGMSPLPFAPSTRIGVRVAIEAHGAHEQIGGEAKLGALPLLEAWHVAALNSLRPTERGRTLAVLQKAKAV